MGRREVTREADDASVHADEKEQAVRLVRQLRKELGTDHGTVGGSMDEP